MCYSIIGERKDRIDLRVTNANQSDSFDLLADSTGL